MEFDLGERLAFAGLDERVKELEAVLDGKQLTINRLEESEWLLEEGNKWLREYRQVLTGALDELVCVCKQVRTVSLDGVCSSDFLTVIERAQYALDRCGGE